MTDITLKANAKINLCLHITKKKQDGYHEIDSVFQSIDLFDLISIKKAKSISVTCEALLVPDGKENICYRAAEMFRQKTGIPGAKITITKKIPAEAGLGGGSADAAAVIMGLNRLYECGLSDQETGAIAQSVGADVPFFIRGGCCRARGTGEILTVLNQPFDHDIVIIKPEAGVSTPEAYRLFDQRHVLGGSADVMVKAIEIKDEAAYIASIENALEPCAFSLSPKTGEAVSAMIMAGAMRARVTGSGAAVFGVFHPGEGADAVKYLRENGFGDVFLTHKTETGIEVISRQKPGL